MHVREVIEAMHIVTSNIRNIVLVMGGKRYLLDVTACHFGELVIQKLRAVLRKHKDQYT